MSMKGIAGWDVSVNPGAVRSRTGVCITGERSDSSISTYGWNLFLQNSIPLHSKFYVDTAAEPGRNRKSKEVSIQIMQFGLQGLLATKSQLWKFPC